MEDSSSSCVVLDGGVSDHGAHAATSPQIMPLSPDSPAWMLMHELSGQTHIPPRQRAYAQFRIPPLLIHHARWGGGSKLNLPSFILIDLAKGPFLASMAHVLIGPFSSNRGCLSHVVAIGDRVSWGSCGSDVGVGSQIIRVDEKRMEKTKLIRER